MPGSSLSSVSFRVSSVAEATQSYRAESDQLGRFIEDECDNLPTVEVGARKLYLAYKYWAEHGGENILSETAFGLNLSERGLQRPIKKQGLSTSRSACDHCTDQVTGFFHVKTLIIKC